MDLCASKRFQVAQERGLERKEGQKRGSGKRVREDGQRRGLDGGGCTNTCMFNRQVEWIVECLRGW